MEEEEKKESPKSAPFLPYDITLKDNFHIYDNTEYFRDKNRTEDFPLMTSGKIVKNFEQKLTEDIKEIQNGENNS